MAPEETFAVIWGNELIMRWSSDVKSGHCGACEALKCVLCILLHVGDENNPAVEETAVWFNTLTFPSLKLAAINFFMC